MANIQSPNLENHLPFQMSYALDELCRAHKLGNHLAVVSGLRLCAKNDHRAPDWLIEAAARRLSETTATIPQTGRGRTPDRRREVLRDMVDFARWRATIEVRSLQAQARQRVEDLSFTHNADSCRRNVQIWSIRVGRSWHDAYRIAAESILFRSSAFGGWQAVRRSYFAVQKNKRVPETSARYVGFTREVLEEHGFDLVHNLTQDEKYVALFEP